MKASNKLLLVVIVLALAIPPFLFMGFRSKIRKNEYTTVNLLNSTKKALPVIRHLRVSGAALACNVLYSPQSYYEKVNNNTFKGDSISFRLDNDTLIITHVYDASSSKGVLAAQTVSVCLSTLQSITASGATINLDSASRNLVIDIRSGALNIGRYDFSGIDYSRYEYAGPGREVDHLSLEGPDGSRVRGYHYFQRLTITARNSSIHIGNTNRIDQLQLTAQRNSKVEIRESAEIRQFIPDFDATTVVSARWPYLQQLSIARR